MFFFPIRILLYIFTDDVMNCNELSSSSSLLGLFYYVRVLIYLRPHLLLAQLSEKKSCQQELENEKLFSSLLLICTWWWCHHRHFGAWHTIGVFLLFQSQNIYTQRFCVISFLLLFTVPRPRKKYFIFALSLFFIISSLRLSSRDFSSGLARASEEAKTKEEKNIKNSMAEDAAEMLGRLLTPPRMLFFSSHFLPSSLPPFFSFLPHHHRLHSLLCAAKKLNFHRQFFVDSRAHLIQLIAGFHLENFSKLGRDFLR